MERINQKTTKQIKRENKNWLLLVTVNDIETNSLLSRIKPLKDYSDILVAYSKNNTYFIGRFGTYNVIHVQSDIPYCQTAYHTRPKNIQTHGRNLARSSWAHKLSGSTGRIALAS